jgi:hypothetical protein
MRREIVTLRAQANSAAQKIERISVNEKQSEELYELIQPINSCDTGQQALQSIFQEADSTEAMMPNDSTTINNKMVSVLCETCYWGLCVYQLLVTGGKSNH